MLSAIEEEYFMGTNSRGVLLTGASGYIGYNLTKYLVSKGFNVHLIVRNNSNIRDLNLFTKFIHIYNGIPETIEMIINTYNLDYVIHLATHSDKSDDSSTLAKLNDVCLNLTNQLFSVIKKQKYQIAFINIGTIWQMHKKSNNAYSLYKCFQEELAKFYSIKYDIKVLSLLLTDSYGPNDWRPKLLNHLKDAVLNGYEFQISNPNGKINLVFIDDICDAIYQSMELVKNQRSSFSNYKLQANKTIDLKDLVSSIEMIMDHSVNVKFLEDKSSVEVEIDNSVSLLTGWSPKIDLNTGLTRFFGKKE